MMEMGSLILSGDFFAGFQKTDSHLRKLTSILGCAKGRVESSRVESNESHELLTEG